MSTKNISEAILKNIGVEMLPESKKPIDLLDELDQIINMLGGRFRRDLSSYDKSYRKDLDAADKILVGLANKFDKDHIK